MRPKLLVAILLLALFGLGATSFQKFIFTPVNNIYFDQVSASTTTAAAICSSRPTRTSFNCENDSSTVVCVSTTAITQATISSTKHWDLGQNERLPMELESYTGILYAISSGTTGNPVTMQTMELYR